MSYGWALLLVLETWINAIEDVAWQVAIVLAIAFLPPLSFLALLVWAWFLRRKTGIQPSPFWKRGLLGPVACRRYVLDVIERGNSSP